MKDVVRVGSRVRIKNGTYAGMTGTVVAEIEPKEWYVVLDRGFKVVVRQDYTEDENDSVAN